MQDKTFAQRVDAHIQAFNELLDEATPQQVATSAAFAAARFTAWMCFLNCRSGDEMKARLSDAVPGFPDEYRRMFEENYQDYASNFDSYRRQMEKPQ
jgi:hypothetical protein